MWPDAKQVDMHSTWEQPFPLNSYKLAFTYFYKWKNNICVYIEGKKQHAQPDKPSAPPSQAHCQDFTCTPRLGLNTGPFCGPRDPEGVSSSEWPSRCTQPLPIYGLKTRQKSQHNLKLCQNNATLFWRYITWQGKKVSTPSSCVRIMQHYFEGPSHAKKSGTPSSCVRIMHQLVPALPTPQTPTVHWTDVSKPAGTSLDDSTSATGPYCRNTKNLCLIINTLAM